MCINNCKIGKVYTIKSLDVKPSLRVRLMAIGMYEGCRIEILYSSQSNFVIKFNRSTFAFRKNDLKNVKVDTI